MNIESILEKVSLFEKLVIDSGMQRDTTDYLQAIQHAQNRTLVFMHDLANKLIDYLNVINENLLGHELEIILKNKKPFTELDSLNILLELNENSTIDAAGYFQEFSILLDVLARALESNVADIQEIKDIFSEYTDKKNIPEEESKAIISLIFKDLESTKSLIGISKALKRWSRTLLIYHTLLTSESPEEISLIGIQEGSIDTLINVDVNIAISLTEVITTALKVYSAYVVYKTDIAQEIIKSYLGNKELIAEEEKRETLMLENINIATEKKIKEQHEKAYKIDNKIDGTSVDKKIKEVCEVIVDHIVKGNEVKLLTLFENEEDEAEQDNKAKVDELNETTLLVRSRTEKLGNEDRQKLLDLFISKEENEE